MQTWTLIFSGIAALGTFVGLLTWLIARRTETRSLEARDVTWTREITNEGWHFTQTSTRPISEVKIILTVDGKSEITRAETLHPHTPLMVASEEHETTQASANEEGARYERELRDFQTPATRTIETGMFNFEIPEIKSPPFPRPAWSAHCSAIITWRYPSGVPDTYEMVWTQEY